VVSQKVSQESLLGSEQEQIDNITLGDAIVSNQITSNTSWIVLQKDYATKVKIGDVAKVFYKKTLF